MKVLQGSAFRAICSIIVGALLVKYREQTVTWITIAMGVLFFLSGLISCLIYFSQKRHADEPQLLDANGNQILGAKPQFPIAGIGSIILGIVLAMMPATFITGLMYVLAAILIVGALNQFFTLASATRFARIGLVWWLMPSLVLLVGIIAVVRPSTIASAPLFVIGWCMMLYGMIECINAIKIYRVKKAFEKLAKAADEAMTSEEEETSAGEAIEEK